MLRLFISSVQKELAAEPLYLAKSIGRMSTGNRNMIRLCRAAGWHEPPYAQAE